MESGVDAERSGKDDSQHADGQQVPIPRQDDVGRDDDMRHPRAIHAAASLDGPSFDIKLYDLANMACIGNTPKKFQSYCPTLHEIRCFCILH
jgi:hypothetical protein